MTTSKGWQVTTKKGTAEVRRLTDMPNIGPAMADDLRRLGITEPAQLAGRDAQDLYDRLAELDGHRHDICVLDTFAAAIEFANGTGNRMWWELSRERKGGVLSKQPDYRKARKAGHQHRARNAPLTDGVNDKDLEVGQIEADSETGQCQSGCSDQPDFAAQQQRSQNR
jgi:hypothetical protein